MRILIYALGGGMGHLARSLALGRAAICRGHAVRILSNSPFADNVRMQIALDWSVDLLEIEALGAEVNPRTAGDYVDQALEGFAPDVLVVDSFPRGLGGELADRIPGLQLPKVYASRMLSDDYRKARNVDRFAHHYDCVIFPGESGIVCKQAIETAPWLICDSSHMLDREQAREALGPRKPGDFQLIVQGSGRQAECDEMSRMALELDRVVGDGVSVRFACLRTVTPPVGHMQMRIWPFMPLLYGVDLLIGAGGYNTVHEAHATRTPLLAMARRRMYDTQHGRLRAEEVAASSFDGLRRQIEKVIHGVSSVQRPAHFVNGTQAAADAIERLCR